MKKIFFFTLLLLHITSRAQIAYYDAKTILDLHPKMISGKLSLADNDIVWKILRNYTGSNDSTKHLMAIALNDNPFISISGPSGGLGIPASNIISAVGGLDVTSIANGLADLMIDRAKQELSVAFFQKFKNYSDKKFPEFATLFPKTAQNLQDLLAYNYHQMLPTLRTGFLDDLSKIPYNLEDLLNLPRYQGLLKNFPEIKIVIRSLRCYQELSTGASNAADIIQECSTFQEFSSSDTSNSVTLRKIGSYLKIAALFSESIRSDSAKSKTDVWVSSKELKSLFYDSTLFNIYMGLVWQVAKRDDLILYGDDNQPMALYKKLGSLKDNLALFQSKFKQFCDLTGEVNSAYKSIKAKRDSSVAPSNDDYYNYINTSIDAVAYATSLVNVFDPNIRADSYIDVLRRANNLYKNTYTKQYSAAVSDAISIISQIEILTKSHIPAHTKKKKDSLAKVYNDWVDRTLNEAKDKSSNHDSMSKALKKDLQLAQSIDSNSDTLKKLATFIDKMTPYMLLIADLANAKTSDDVKTALDNAILPVGSSSIKKSAVFNISVQSYLGAFQRTDGLPDDYVSAWNTRMGVTAPIGFSFSWGIPSFRIPLVNWNIKKPGALTLFTSLLDIGAIVDYKLDSVGTTSSGGTTTTQTQTAYQVKLGQIFAPGVYGVYGFGGNIPLSLGYGGQYGPGLEYVKENTVVNRPRWRWNAFLTIDIPFFNLLNIKRNTRRR